MYVNNRFNLTNFSNLATLYTFLSVPSSGKASMNGHAMRKNSGGGGSASEENGQTRVGIRIK